MNNNYTVYAHKFPDNKYYIGITVQDVNKRWQNGKGYKNQPVYEAIQHFGWDNIEHIIVRKNLSLREAQDLEKQLIFDCDSIEHGYNYDTGGGAGGNSWVKYEYKGETYSPEELAEISNIDEITPHDITTRVGHHGWSVEKAISTPKTIKNQLFEYNGKMYSAKGLVSISNVENLNQHDIFTRINKYGWDVERAITQPKNKKVQPKGVGTCKFEYGGEIYNSYELVQLSNVEGLTPLDITTRINKHGWTVEDAITKPKKSHNKLYEYDGKLLTSKQLAEISPIKDIKPNNITDRIRNGWTIEKAISTEIRKDKK